MGNVGSCAPSMNHTAAAIKVFFPDGRLRVYTRPVQAAELMIENPGSFLCDSSDLIVGHRVPGLCSDESLEPRRTYFVLPLEMLYSVLTDEEMSFLNDVIASRNSKHGVNLSKILPVLHDFNCLFPNPESEKRLGMDYAEEDDQLTDDDSSRRGSWRPSLETIFEMPTPPHEFDLY